MGKNRRTTRSNRRLHNLPISLDYHRRNRVQMKPVEQPWSAAAEFYKGKAKLQALRRNQAVVPRLKPQLAALPKLWRVNKVYKTLRSVKTNTPLSKLKVATTVAALKASSPQMVCVQRAQRREIMFSTKKAGSTGQKKPTFTWKSKIRCK